jgi:hypothetical protein
MARCWEIRDCVEDEGDLIDTCAHANEFFDRCPTKCAFANCQRPQREHTADAALIFDPTVDRGVAIKEVCLHCGFFLEKGPRVEDEA